MVYLVLQRCVFDFFSGEKASEIIDYFIFATKIKHSIRALVIIIKERLERGEITNVSVAEANSNHG